MLVKNRTNTIHCPDLPHYWQYRTQTVVRQELACEIQGMTASPSISYGL